MIDASVIFMGLISNHPHLLVLSLFSLRTALCEDSAHYGVRRPVPGDPIRLENGTGTREDGWRWLQHLEGATEYSE